MQIPYETSPTWPPEADPTRTCGCCGLAVGPQPAFKVQMLGFLQVVPGKDAVEAADCLYHCQFCHVVEYVRVIRG